MKPEPRRIVSLSANVSMILFALGEGERIVGRTRYCIEAIGRYLTQGPAPGAEIAERLNRWEAAASVGGWVTLDKDVVRALDPHLVFTSGSCLPYSPADFGLPATIFRHFDTRTIADLHESIRAVGAAIHREDEAESLIRDLDRKTASALRELLDSTRSPRIYVERCICVKSQAVANPEKRVMIGGHLAPEMVGLVKGTFNLVRPGEPCRWMDARKVVDDRPDVIILNRCTQCPIQQAEDIRARKGWEDLPAVRNDLVFTTPNVCNANLCYPEALSALVEAVNAFSARAERA